MRAAALALVLATLGETTSDNPEAMQLLHEWVLAVDSHTAGERDPALRSIGEWTYDDLDMMRPYVEMIAELPNKTKDRDARRSHVSGGDRAKIRQRTMDLQGRGDFNLFLKRAAILHTDLALLTFVPMVVDPPTAARRPPRQGRSISSPVVDVRSADGRAEDFQRANPHWDFSMDMLEALPSKPQRDPFVGQWFSTIAAYFARQDNTADGLRHFDRARSIVPDHPDVNYAEACLQEKLGAPRIQDFAKVTRLPNGLTLIGVTSAQTHFRRAETLLRKALAAKPDFPAASLRLGHVLAEKKEFDAAITVLQQVIPKLDQPAAYYAHLFAGDAALALGRGADARASFEKALELYERSQAARLGLGATLRYMGDRQAALDAMQLTLNMAADERDALDEPWWDYYEGDRDQVDRLLGQLREPFRSPRQ
jgi:tetratricopeptide (TPR) repeat protein